MPLLYWVTPSRGLIALILLIKFINLELKNNLSKRNLKTLNFFFGTFLVILINNLIGLYPYIFTATRHLVVAITLALPVWTILMLFGWLNQTKHMFTHLVPLGTPMGLSFFIVFIETISNTIRPMTLSVRLAANIIAGHLLLRLLREISEHAPTMYLPSAIILVILLILEYAVATIQSYVFITLASLYLSEIN